ncbi:hypothetical protein ACJX0J_006934, partial [Zea mays]
VLIITPLLLQILRDVGIYSKSTYLDDGAKTGTPFKNSRSTSIQRTICCGLIIEITCIKGLFSYRSILFKNRPYINLYTSLKKNREFTKHGRTSGRGLEEDGFRVRYRMNVELKTHLLTKIINHT